MPPLQPLSDLSLIAIFKELNPTDQLKASKTSPRWKVLVRVANLQVKSLFITEEVILKEAIKSISTFCFEFKPSMQLAFPDNPMISTPLSKWNCLVLDDKVELDSPTIKHIGSIFPAVTDLKFITDGPRKLGALVELLQHPQYTNQLTSLMAYHIDFFSFPTELVCPLIAAINGLSVLQRLAVRWYSEELPDLTILAQLKVFVFKCQKIESSFLRDLNRYAEENVDLKVRLFPLGWFPWKDLSEPLRNRIVCYGDRIGRFSLDEVAECCQHFPSLASLGVSSRYPLIDSRLFTELTKLQRLVHLEVSLSECNKKSRRETQPLRQLNSVRALDLDFTIRSHKQVQWLNLQWKLPNCQAIHLKQFTCTSCNVYLRSYLDGKYDNDSIPSSSKALNCLRTSLSSLHSGVHPRRIILGEDEPFTSLEQLLQSNEQ